MWVHDMSPGCSTRLNACAVQLSVYRKTTTEDDAATLHHTCILKFSFTYAGFRLRSSPHSLYAQTAPTSCHSASEFGSTAIQMWLVLPGW